MEPGRYVKHDRDFWVEKWKSFQGENNFSSMRYIQNHHGRNWSNERKEKMDAMIQEGKSPKEIWTSHMEEISKDGYIFKAGPFAEPEMKNKWEEMKKEGKTEEFWENYWNEAQNGSHQIGPKFINPHDMQKRWEEMKEEGKTPDEFWKEQKEKFFEKMQGTSWGHHWMHKHRFWTRGENNVNKDGEKIDTVNHHYFGHCYRSCWGRKKQREYDEDPLFKEFDF